LRFGRLLLLAGGFGWVAGGCESELKLELEGLSCSDDYRCAAGYVCDKDRDVCVRPVLGEAGTGGSGTGGSQTEPTGGTGSGASGAAGNAGGGGSAPLGGQGGGGDGGSDDLDAGPPALIDGGPDGCVPTTLFRDRDDDTYGDVTVPGHGCPQQGWVTRAGDCRDDLPLVNVGQQGFFGEGFVDQNKPGNISFDYNCNNVEEPSPNNNTNDPLPDCAGLIGLGVACEGSGFLPANEPPRTGSGADERCGSILRRDCRSAGLTCEFDDTPVNELLRFVCR
jgi:hypothetical protein